MMDRHSLAAGQAQMCRIVHKRACSTQGALPGKEARCPRFRQRVPSPEALGGHRFASLR